MQNKVAFYLEEGEFAERAKAIAKKLNLPILNEITADFPFVLCLGHDGLSLRSTETKRMKPLRVDFTSRQALYRFRAASRKVEAIAKAVGLKRNITPIVLDVTAGLGQDAFILVVLGCQMTLIERSPIVCALLEDGLNRAKKDARVCHAVERICLIEGDSIQYMRTLKSKPDVVYIDPMFPKRKKQAAVKKGMAILQALLIDAVDVKLLFDAAIETAKNRVVVKRPRLAEFIAETKPSFSVQGSSSRFDVYLL